jgi:hypothetical protein
MASVKKAQFARMCNVSRTRVTQWCKEGKIDGAALVGAMIDPDVALRQLKSRLDSDQMATMNGLNTRLNHGADEIEAEKERLALDALNFFDRMLAEWPVKSLEQLEMLRAEVSEAFRQCEGRLRYDVKAKTPNAKAQVAKKPEKAASPAVL